MKKRSVEVWDFCVTVRILTPQKCRHFEDPKNILRNTGSFTPPLEGPWGFLGQFFLVSVEFVVVFLGLSPQDFDGVGYSDT